MIMVLVLLALIVSLIVFREQIVQNWIWILLILALIIIPVWFPVIIFMTDYEKAVIFRFGKVQRVGGPGWVFIIPLIENYTVVDLRVKTLDISKQDVITKDSVELKVDAVIYIRVKDDSASITSSVVEVEDFMKATELYVISSIRNIMGSFTLAEAISNIEEMNLRLVKSLEKISATWGIQVDAAEMKDIDIPEDVLNAMHEDKAASSKRSARLKLAEATKAEIDAVRIAAEQLSDKALAYYYIQALEKLGQGASTKFIFPMELTHLASMVGGAKSSVSQKEMDELFAKYAPMIKQLTEGKGKKK